MDINFSSDISTGTYDQNNSDVWLSYNVTPDGQENGQHWDQGTGPTTYTVDITRRDKYAAISCNAVFDNGANKKCSIYNNRHTPVSQKTSVEPITAVICKKPAEKGGF